jgi:hypothetical protein
VTDSNISGRQDAHSPGRNGTRLRQSPVVSIRDCNQVEL